MASQRIEIAEVVSFRLSLPQSALGQLVQSLEPELPVKLSDAGGDLFLRSLQGDSFLRFRPAGDHAVLTQVSVCNDVRGAFFHQVIGTLVKEHGGDLHVRLVWNDSDRNLQGDFAEIVVQHGQTSYPEFAPQAGSKNHVTESLEPLFPVPEEESNVQALLTQAKAHWEEYLRLKAARS